MRRFCDFKEKQICEVIGNITQSRISRLCSIGLEVICKEERYKNIIDDFIKEKAS